MKNKNIDIKLILLLLISICIISFCIVGLIQIGKPEKKYHNPLSGTITVWSWNESLITSGMIKSFNQKYPDIKINLVTIPYENNAYITKLSSTLLSGVSAPDVYLAECTFVRSLCNQGFYENLSQPPYNAEKIAKEMTPYTVTLGRNQDDNTIRALSWQVTPGGMYYRRSLAKKYLGTEDPNEIQNMILTDKDLFKLGETIQEKSNNKVSMIASYLSLYQLYFSNCKDGWIKNGKLNIDQCMYDYLDMAKAIREKDLDANKDPYTTSWSNSIKDRSVFGYILPSWGLNGILLDRAPDSSGDWGFVETPTSYYSGGSWMGIYRDSKHKKLAWTFIKYIVNDKRFLKNYAITSGEFVNNTSIQKELAQSSFGENRAVDNQNLYSSFLSMSDSINASTVSSYDEKIKPAFMDCVKQYVNNMATKEECIQSFKKRIKKLYPDLVD